MATKKSVGDLKEADLKGKKVFVRVNLNVPLDDNFNIIDDTRIRAAVPTTKYLMGHGSKVILSSHLPVASILGILQENIFANQLLFGSSGEFLGFDANDPTLRSEGKATVVQQIRKVKGYKALVMIGDGATDLEPSSFFFLLISRISPGIEELVKKLKARNTDVYLISGGFRQMINI
ncbi:phosphoserine phosphatase, chloroplastic-like [Gossypium arboreum]|uniref:phosphoserine phosphatase, chloroplastic-like n=1 Tax=Gossypium arboreum TaxID=29729 RepID=UPI0022F158C6|nr:phosphoserine phosphatase, chloroplastic-like [Gossypium arboreum]